MNMLQELLADGVKYDPHYPPHGFADHLPMTLCAMHALGGDDAVLLAYRDDYARILKEVSPASPFADWRQGVGQPDAYPHLLTSMREAIDQRGVESVVREILPEMIGGLASDAFHPLIRLAYALDFDCPAEVAVALAYMVSVHVELPADTGHSVELGEALRAQSREGPGLKPGPFNAGLTRLAEEDRYPLGVAAGLDDCARHALDIYRSTRNFFALHMVTATQAARVCSAYVDEKLALACLTGALLAAHQIVGCPEFDAKRPLAVPRQVDREHVYKYIFACVSEYRATGDARYLEEIAGFREKGLIPDWAARGIA